MIRHTVRHKKRLRCLLSIDSYLPCVCLSQLLLQVAWSAFCLPSSSSSSWSTAWGRRMRAAMTWERGNPLAQPIRKPQPRSFMHKTPPSCHQIDESQANLFKHNKKQHVFKLIKEKNSIKKSFCIECCNWDLFFLSFLKKMKTEHFSFNVKSQCIILCIFWKGWGEKINNICKGEETDRICLLLKELFLVADYF